MYRLLQTDFITARSSYASAVLGIAILSVRLSVCHIRALWWNDRTYSWNFYTTWKDNQSSFLIPKEGGGDVPFHMKFALNWPTPFEKLWLRPIYTYNVSTVRASKKCSKTANSKSTTRFSTSLDEVRKLPLTRPKGGSKSEFVVFVNKIQVQSNKVCYKVYLCENFHWFCFSF